MFKRIESSALSLLLFLLPTQLAFHFWPKEAFVFGIRVDYLSPAIYLTDILAVLLILLWIYLRKSEFLKTIKKYRKVLYVFFALAIFNVLFSTIPTLSLFRWIKYLEFFALALYLKSKNNYSIKPLYYSGVLFSLIGIFQFATGGTLGGPLYFFGERLFNTSTPGIALFNINGREFLRAYSTFAHPNSMAGYLGLLSIFLLLSNDLKKLNFKFLGFGIIFLAILLTFSISAFMAIIISTLLLFIIKKYQKKYGVSIYILILALLFSVVQTLALGQTSSNKYVSYERVAQRLELANIAGQSAIESPIFGKGLNTFIPNLPKFQVGGNSIWLLQPVHNIFLLAFSETGMVGLIVIVTFVYLMLIKFGKTKKYYLLIPFIFVILTGTTDHYWLTLQQNNLLLVFLISHFT